MKTIGEFVEEYAITVNSERVQSNPRLFAHVATDITFSSNCTHWRVMVKRKRSTRAALTVYFSRRGRTEDAPKPEEVLDALAVDATMSDANPREVANELALDMNSATKYVEICKKRANGLRRVLGEGAYHTLLSETHRMLS